MKRKISLIFLGCTNQEKLRKLDFNSIVHLQINGSGNQNVLSNSFNGGNPDIIIVNNQTIQNYNGKVAKNLENGINNITLIWNSQVIEDCSYMFQGLS